jgi:hypothetical protein
VAALLRPDGSLYPDRQVSLFEVFCKSFPVLQIACVLNVGLDEGFVCSLAFSCVFDQGPGVRLGKQGLLMMVVYLAGGFNCDSI